ncbi:Myb-like_DNA-binding domain-containing protein [Hexamita inflata]|uniref:Myb-like DNA-binding domain-containing protein n=1 Tax=Hexamita inflata TaxID=28002 RepID=A0AA86TFE4_9EUKA|nr:Myb-like DNA-binding domain-containing protein [Hexamita inflata]
MSYHFWTEEEGALLVAAVKKYGFRWEEIQFKVFPGLSVAKLKNKFYSDRRFKADAALPLTDAEKLGLKRRKRAPVPVEAKEAPSSEVDVDQLVMALRQMTK